MTTGHDERRLTIGRCYVILLHHLDTSCSCIVTHIRTSATECNVTRSINYQIKSDLYSWEMDARASWNVLWDNEWSFWYHTENTNVLTVADNSKMCGHSVKLIKCHVLLIHSCIQWLEFVTISGAGNSMAAAIPIWNLVWQRHTNPTKFGQLFLRKIIKPPDVRF